MDDVAEPDVALDAVELPESTLEEREAEYDRFVWANLKRNYLGNYLHGMLGMTGFRLVNAPTFIPAYLHMLGVGVQAVLPKAIHAFAGPDAVVGLGLALQQLGQVISPIIGASQIEHRKRVLPVAMLMGTMMRVQILGMAIVGWLLHGLPLLLAMLFFLTLLGLFSGCQRVAFQLLLSKVIPIARRGRLQAWRNFTGGLIAASLSYVAGRYLIGQQVWGNGYSTTFLAAFVLTSLGLTALSMLLREPDPPSVRPKMGVAQRLKDVPSLLMGDRGFLYFMIAQTCSVAGRIAVPFYVLFARSTIELTGANIGLLSLAYLGADTVSNILWGYLGDKGGFRSTFIIALVSWIAATILLMAAHNEALILVAFFGLGAAQSGYNMSSQTMVLEFGLREDIAMRLAFSSTAEGIMATLGPLVGGLLAVTVGYKNLFWTSIGFEVVALILLLTLVEEPRKRGHYRPATAKPAG